MSIGVNLGGPEPVGIDASLRAAMRVVKAARGNGYESHTTSAVNVVFYVPGSLMDYADLKKIEAARFSRKQNLLLVAVPVPKEVEGGGSVEFVTSALHEANRIAAETFAKKGAGPFDLERAEAIVEQLRKALVDQGF